MSLIHPACDTRHIIQRAMKSKTLGTLAKEEEMAELLRTSNTSIVYHTKPTPPHKRILLTKEDLQNFKYLIKGKSNDVIFNTLGIRVEYNENGSKSISHYSWPFNSFSFSAAGIDEEKLLEGVTEIQGYCDLTGSKLENLCSVKRIRGDLVIPLFTKLKDLSGVEQIDRNIICSAENIEDTKDVIKKLNINPQALKNGVVTTKPWGIYTGEFYSLPQQQTEQLNKIQAEASYK